MATDSTIRDHQAWLGYLQPDGLVVSPAALVDAQVLLDRNAAPLQQRFLEFVSESEKDGQTTWSLTSLKTFLLNFLEWPVEYLAGRDATDPIPESLQVPLREFGETLQPTYAFRDPNAPEGEAGYLLLLQDFPAGTDLDAPVESAMAGWSASHTRRFERLLRETRVPIGLISNHHVLRIVYAPRGENAGTLTFPVSAMAEIAGRPILAALEMLLSSYRLLSAPSEARLPALLKRSRDYQGRVSTQLARQVL
ncbi:MAG: class I SAM-dependent DNA methyltransferase, partial [Planctomycetota bacterium]